MKVVSLPAAVGRMPHIGKAAQQPTRRPRIEAASASYALSIATKGKRAQAQRSLLEAIQGAKGRGKTGLSSQQLELLEEAVAVLEADGGVRDPAASLLLEGRWRLLFTTRPGTASPIQRTFTGVEGFSVFQDIELSGDGQARVNNVVDFGKGIGYLKVEAEASTDARPIPGFEPRRGVGLPFGLLGVSSTEPPASPNVRVDFQFDRAAFYFKALPFSVPYPVPFRLLGDERKGWIDTTYLSPDGRFRLSRGNKGTLFVLEKVITPKDRLLEAVASGASDDDVEEAALALQRSGDGLRAPARSAAAVGKWRLTWTRQGKTANPLQRALSKQVANWQIISEGGGVLENRVEPLPGVAVRALAACEPDSDDRTGVEITEVVIEVGPLRLPIPVRRDARGFVDWLYLDAELRVTRGSKGSLFVHTRDDPEGNS